MARSLAVLSRVGGGPVHDEMTLDDLAARAVTLRRGIDRLAERGRVPGDTRIQPITSGPVPGEWVRPAGSNPDRVILHLHGGAYTLCSPATHRLLVRGLAKVSKAVAFVPDYRLAPEHPFPAAVEDAVATYRWLIEDQRIDPERIAVTGDSAGGGLAVATLLQARQQGLPLPGAYVGLSPWTDLTGASPSIEENNGRDILFGAIPTALAARLGELYASDTSHPLASPVYADLTGLPPMLVHVGGNELIRDDGIRLVERARTYGVDASAGIFDGLWHVFQVFPIPESRRSLREIGGFIRRHLPD